MKTALTCVLVFATLFALGTVAAEAQVSAVPAALNFQGRIATPSGNPVASGTYSIRFRMYDALTGGTLKWEQTISSVAVVNGTFAVTLNVASGFQNGATAANLFYTNLYLDIKIGSEPVLTPRTALVAVPYAMKANLALGVMDGSITTTSIINGAITSSKILNGAIGAPELAANSIITGKIADGAVTSIKLAGDISLSKIAPTDINNLLWKLDGNNTSTSSITTPFLGTTNDVPLEFRTNNMPVMRMQYGFYSNLYRAINIVSGSPLNSVGIVARGATIAGGGYDAPEGTDRPNVINSLFGTIGGGAGNNISDAHDLFGTVGGGYLNWIVGDYGTIGGGSTNYVWGDYSAVLGGLGSHISNASHTVVVGGNGNMVFQGHSNFIGGGFGNDVYVSTYGTIVSGKNNNIGGTLATPAEGDYGFIGGGEDNFVHGDYAAIVGGEDNISAGDTSFVGGGRNNQALGNFSVIAGGVNQLAEGLYGVISGGAANRANNNYATVGGGYFNQVTGAYSVIGGGYSNQVTGDYSAITGGREAVIYGDYSAIVGGKDLTVVGNNSVAMGSNATMDHSNTFMWNDGQGLPRESGNSHQFVVFALNGVAINIDDAAPYSLRVNGAVAGSGSYINTSDARFKKNVATIENGLDLILQLRGVSYEWRKSEFPKMILADGRQVGFLAQEVEQVLPNSVTTARNGDKGVAYSDVIPLLVESVKTLNARSVLQQKGIADRDRQINTLIEQNKSLEARLNAIEARLNAPVSNAVKR